MNNESSKPICTSLIATLSTAFLISGCEDIQYDFDIPKQESHCTDNGLVLRHLPPDEGDVDNSDGGSVIRDRDGGSAIRDRFDELVKDYCHRECAQGEMPVGDIVMNWQNKNKYIEAGRTCATP